MINAKQSAVIALILIVSIPILAGYAFASESTTETRNVVEESVSLSDTLLNSSAYYDADYTGPNNNSLMAAGYGGGAWSFYAPAYVYTSTTETSIAIGANSTETLTVASGDYTSLSSLDYSTWSFTASGITILLTYIDGSTRTLYFAAGEFLKIGSTFMAKDGGYNPTYSYPLVSDVSIMPDSNTTVTLNYYLSGTTTYADASYGWSIPNSTYTYNWVNGYSNESVTFYLHMDTPSSGTDTAIFSPYSGTYDGNSDIDFMLSSAGVMTIKPDYSDTTYTLGTYNDVMIVYDLAAETCTVSGIAAWPTMGGTPATYNYVSFETYDGLTDILPMVCIGGETSAVWRCDSAHIVAGTFPITEDYTLSMASLFPDKDYNLKFNSVGIYGDTLTVDGTAYTVTDGTITVDGETVNVKGMEIQVTEDSGTWTTSINGEQVSTSAAAPTVVFGGQWSLTATAEILTEETVAVDEWAPGQFAFDRDGFILMLVMVAAGVFVALGFTAGRSGAKVLALLLTCGGAAAIALMIV